MSTQEAARPSVPSVSLACRSLGLVALYIPLSGVLLCNHFIDLVGDLLGWVALLTGLHGLRAARVEPTLTRRAAWLAGMAWVSLALTVTDKLPFWTGLPGPSKACSAVLQVALIAGIALVVRDMARLCEALSFGDFASRWRRVSWGWWVLLIFIGLAAVVSLARQMAGETGNIQMPWSTVWLLPVLAVMLLAPPVMLWNAAMSTHRALHPHSERCPQCGYPRAGLPRNKCPECGCFLDPLVEDRRFGRSAGTTARLRRLVVWPAAMVALCFGVAGALDARLGGVAWRPAWMLVRDAEETVKLDQAARSLSFWMARPSPGQTRWSSPAADLAQRELLARLTGGGVTRDIARRIIETALAVQADVTRDMGSWAALFVDCHRLGFVEREELDRFLVGSVQWGLKTRPVVAEGDPIPFDLTWTWRGPGPGGPLPDSNNVLQSLQIDLNELSIGGAAAGEPPPRDADIPYTGVLQGGAFRFTGAAAIKGWSLPRAVVEPGDREFRVVFDVGVGGPRARVMKTLSEDPIGYRVPRRVVVTTPVKVVPRGAAVTTTVSDPAVRKEIAGIGQAELRYYGLEGGELWIRLRGRVPDPAPEYAFEAVIEVDGREFAVGPVTMGGDWSGFTRLAMSDELTAALGPAVQDMRGREQARRRAPPAPPRVRVLLRPSDAAARLMPGALKILEGGDIELRVAESD